MADHEKKDELWQLEARKLGGQQLVDVISDVKYNVETVIDRLDKMDDRHVEQERLNTLFRSAIPGSDWEGHRRYHETMIESLAERRRLRIAIQEKTISGLVWAGIMGAGIAIWRALLTAIHGAPPP